MNFLFSFMLWLFGMVVFDDDMARVEQDIQARGRCRNIQADKNVVRITFLNDEDAEKFADDLKKFIENK